MIGPTLPIASVATTVAIFLIALAVALTFLYFGLKWVSRNEDETRAALAKVGITAPDPQPTTPDPSIAPPPAPAIPAPPQPIVLTPPSPPAPAATSSGGQAYLVDVNGRNFPLSEGNNVVSRESGEIVLAGEATVSRRHAELVKNGGTVILRDLGSTNGTFVNGARVQGDQVLMTGDSVRFGAVTMHYQS